MVTAGIAEVGSSVSSELSGITLSTFHDPASPLRHRQIDELAVLGPGRRTAGLVERSQHTRRPCQLFRRGSEDLVDDRQLSRVDGRLAEESQSPCRLGLSAKASVVFKERMDAITRRWLAGGPRGGHQVRTGE